MPTLPHEDLVVILANLVDVAGSALSGALIALGTARLREPGAPPGTGMEPDCAFYVGENARGYHAALAKGRGAADAFFANTAPDLVVEVEVTNADEEKIDRYGDLGVRELWLIRHRGGEEIPDVEFLALRGARRRQLAASNVLGGLAPADVREAVSGIRGALTRDQRTAAVAGIVGRAGAQGRKSRNRPRRTPPAAGSV